MMKAPLFLYFCGILYRYETTIQRGNLILTDLLENQILIASLLAWLSAQLLKVVLYAVVNREFRISRLFGDGGMPSGHSAAVTALAASSGLHYGLGSFQFAVTSILAIIVMHDAMGVRQESGKHTKIINELMEWLDPESPLQPEEKLKELLGHTPLQVACGMLVGLCAARLIF